MAEKAESHAVPGYEYDPIEVGLPIHCRYF